MVKKERRKGQDDKITYGKTQQGRIEDKNVMRRQQGGNVRKYQLTIEITKILVHLVLSGLPRTIKEQQNFQGTQSIVNKHFDQKRPRLTANQVFVCPLVSRNKNVFYRRLKLIIHFFKNKNTVEAGPKMVSGGRKRLARSWFWTFAYVVAGSQVVRKSHKICPRFSAGFREALKVPAMASYVLVHHVACIYY